MYSPLITSSAPCIPLKQRKTKYYVQLYCGFDIETTSVDSTQHSYMYIWQFGIKNTHGEQDVIFGRKWSDFLSLIDELNRVLSLNDRKRLIIWVANLSYEFSFFYKYFGKPDEFFAKEPHQPLIVRYGGIEFREALSISQGSLSYLAKTWTKTQKLKGDLDYTIPRNSKTPLTEKELGYCRNDVIILSEFSEKIFNEYLIPQKYIPVTSTGILRHDLKERAKQNCGAYTINQEMEELHPETKDEYIFIMRYLFRGGFVHARWDKVGEVIADSDGYDLKSSYPSVILKCYAPTSPFRRIEYTPENFDKAISTKCCFFVAKFKNFSATTQHSIESLSKVISSVNPLVDNGRIHRADELTVALTELDYATYCEFYEWDSMDVQFLYVSNRGRYPKYLVDGVYRWYNIKESIDKEQYPQEYAISKTRVNGHFGLCCTRLVFEDVKFNGEEWESVPTEKSYQDMIKKQFLSPYFGIWITAHARRNELSLLFKMKDEVFYSDTDSHKLITTPNALRVIENYNKEQVYLNHKCAEFYGYDFRIIAKLGTLEHETAEGKMRKFKTLGAKRYIYEDCNGDLHSTISGLSKSALADYCKSKGVDPFEYFDDDMEIGIEFASKLRPIRNTEPSSAYITDQFGNTERMHEESDTYLAPVEFTLTMDDLWISLLMSKQFELEKYM